MPKIITKGLMYITKIIAMVVAIKIKEEMTKTI